MIPCPRCPKTLPDEDALYSHLRSVHKLSPEEIGRLMPLGSGWFEEQRETPRGMAAVEHQLAALKAKLASDRKDTLRIPMVPMQVKRSVRVPGGWVAAEGGYSFEKVISERLGYDFVVSIVLRSSVKGNHAQAVLYTYTRDVRQLSEMQDKAWVLEARLTGFTVSDPEFVVIVNELHDLKFRISKFSERDGPQPETDLVHEDYFSGDIGSDEHKEWQSGQMEKISAIGDRLAKQGLAESTTLP